MLRKKNDAAACSARLRQRAPACILWSSFLLCFQRQWLVATAEDVISVTDENFDDVLRSKPSALVAFVAPWCTASKDIQSHLTAVRADLDRSRDRAFHVALCDVSRERGLAERYMAFRTPTVLLFKDTRVLAPGLQTVFVGQLVPQQLLSFVRQTSSASQVRSPLELWDEVEQSARGIFAGFFNAPDSNETLQALWSSSCISRHERSVAFAHGPPPESGEELWSWAGLTWSMRASEPSESAVIFIPRQLSIFTKEFEEQPGAGGEEETPEQAPRFRLVERDVHSWRDLMDRFSAWCERQAMPMVPVLDAARAAALDRTAEWLLLLFEPTDPANLQSPLSQEQEPSATVNEQRAEIVEARSRLEAWIRAMRRHDDHFDDLVPVIVPTTSQGYVTAYYAFGAVPQPSHSCARTWSFALFNTKSRRKFVPVAEEGWCTSSNEVLTSWVRSVLNGLVPSRLVSAPISDMAVTPDGVLEVSAAQLQQAVLQPVLAGELKVLMFIYATWCSHSLHLSRLWTSVAASMERMTDGGLLLAQMDGSLNEHPDLPSFEQLPSLLLLQRSPRANEGVRFVEFPGPSSLQSLQAWLAAHGAITV